MKKALAGTLVGLLVLAFAVSLVSAAGSPVKVPPCLSNLTDAQKQEITPLLNQMNDLKMQMLGIQKQMIQKQVEFGNLTQEQANQRIAWMKERLEKGYGPGIGMMGRGPGGMGRGPGSGPCWQQ